MSRAKPGQTEGYPSEVYVKARLAFLTGMAVSGGITFAALYLVWRRYG